MNNQNPMQSVYQILKNKAERPKIAVMRYRFIGDTLLSVPFLKALRCALPQAEIDVLAAPNSGEVLQHCPYIDRLIFWDTTRKHRYENPPEAAPKMEADVQPPQNFWQSLKLLRAQKYDAIFVLKRSFSSALLAFLSGIPLRVGFDTEARGMLLTHQIPYEMERHEISCYLDNLSYTGFPQECLSPEPELEMWFSESETSWAAKTFLPFKGRLNVLLHLSSSNVAKQWPEESAVALTRWLLTQPDVHLHFMGAESDAPIYENLLSRLQSQAGQEDVSRIDQARSRCHNWCGQFEIRQSAAFLKHLQLAIGVDSGTMHVARAVSVPSIVLFGPMSETKWRPPGASVLTHPMDCHPCHLKTPCHEEFSCIRSLSPQRVIDEAKRELARIKLKLAT